LLAKQTKCAGSNVVEMVANFDCKLQWCQEAMLSATQEQRTKYNQPTAKVPENA